MQSLSKLIMQADIGKGLSKDEKWNVDVFLQEAQSTSFEVLHYLTLDCETSYIYVLLTSIIETVQLVGLLIPARPGVLEWNADNKETVLGYISLVDQVNSSNSL